MGEYTESTLRENRFDRDTVKAEHVSEFRVPREVVIAVAGDLPIEKQLEYPMDGIGCGMPRGVAVFESGERATVSWASQPLLVREKSKNRNVII